MKKLFISLCMLCATSASIADGFTGIGDPSVGGVFIITECGKTIQIPNVNYTKEEIDKMITYYTNLLCNQSSDGPLP